MNLPMLALAPSLLDAAPQDAGYAHEAGPRKVTAVKDLVLKDEKRGKELHPRIHHHPYAPWEKTMRGAGPRPRHAGRGSPAEGPAPTLHLVAVHGVCSVVFGRGSPGRRPPRGRRSISSAVPRTTTCPSRSSGRAMAT
jgi:hypothetical protein